MNDVAGFVTAGGQSSRMGTDKAWLELAGRPMIEHVIAALQPVTASLAIVANHPEYEKLGYPVFADSQTGIGPLEAIRTALRNSSSPRVLLVGCDLPFVSVELFKFLLNVSGDYDAIVPTSADETPQPLCAIYCTSALVVVNSLIEKGERRTSLLFDRVSTRFVRFAELQYLAGSEVFFNNVNTPEDHARALETITQILRISKDSTKPSM